jgi:hypothetical protein
VERDAETGELRARLSGAFAFCLAGGLCAGMPSEAGFWSAASGGVVGAAIGYLFGGQIARAGSRARGAFLGGRAALGGIIVWLLGGNALHILSGGTFGFSSEVDTVLPNGMIVMPPAECWSFAVLGTAIGWCLCSAFPSRPTHNAGR